jgi:hypothetical protein
MTAQSMEKLIFNGKEVYMATEPLASYLSKLKKKPKLIFPSSACWRGYYGTWEIKDAKLYLIELECYTANMVERKYWQESMDFIFPNQKEVFADWFTGEIRIPQGDMLEYVHGGYLSTFESDLFLEFKNGQLIGQKTVDNIFEEAKELINKKKEIPPRIQILPKKESIFTRILKLLKRSKKN